MSTPPAPRAEEALRHIRGTLDDLSAGRGTPVGALWEIALTARCGLPASPLRRGAAVSRAALLELLRRMERDAAAAWEGTPLRRVLSRHCAALRALLPEDPAT